MSSTSPLTVAQFHQRLDTGDDVFLAERPHGVFGIQSQTHVHLDPANRRQVIALAVEEKRIEQGRGRFNGGRLARTHDAVDVHQRAFAVHVLVGCHGVAHVGANGDIIDVQNRNVGDPGIHQLFQRTARDLAVLVEFPGQFVPGFDIDRAGFLVDDVLGRKLANDLVEWHQKIDDLAVVDDLLDGPRRDLLARRGKGLAGLGVHQIKRRPRAAHTFGEELGHPSLVLFVLVFDGIIVGIHDAFLIQAQRIQKRRDRQLPTTVDAGIDDVLGVELEVQPRAAIGNDPAGKKQFAAGVRLALVVVKEDARRTVHLGHDHTLCPVHDERAVWRHQGHIAHEHVLFLDVLDGLGTGVFVDVENDQAQGDLQRCRIGHVALLTFFNVVLRLLKLVFHELQDCRLVEILNRKYRLEDAHDAFAVKRLGLVAGV